MKTIDLFITKYPRKVVLGELELRAVENGRNRYEGVVL
jgi:hypothetical protein